MRIHRMGVGEDEAKLSLEAHGEPETCFYKDCDEACTAVFLIRKTPGVWGSIVCVGTCDEHEQDTLRLRKQAEGHAMPSDLCPACGHPLNRASSVDDQPEAPSPGDFSLCAECGELLRINAEHRTELAPDDWQSILSPDQVQAILAVQEEIRARPRRSTSSSVFQGTKDN